ncbi:hypothetical protein [Evansella tamaricis]|uniref:Uncharacterized protein n=1 Tax=Evansella tamaricis TaxID=2069301 RepID=A0ABS6JGN4_9BACI|nr:hypothetical protein [Evansella tamaricis]MBU9712834.1 hypothetical protein [Evansella tamaricis]
MKSTFIFFILLSMISIQSCTPSKSHEDIHLKLSPIYSDGVLYLTPVITYDGELPVTLYYGNTVAWIETVKKEDETIYTNEEHNLLLDHQSTLEQDDEREGETIELEVDPGTYEVVLKAVYSLSVNGETAELEGEEYTHRLTQKLELKR